MPRRPRSLPAASLVLVVVVAVAATLVAVAPARAATVTVVLDDGASPNEVTVGPDDAVAIRNDDDERHRLRAREPEDVDTDDIDPGRTATVTFPVTGTYVLVDERTDDPAFSLRVVVAEEPASPSTSPTGGSSPAAPATAEVAIPDRLFSPGEVTVRAGGSVTWTNSDGSHTVTARDGSFDSGVFDAGTFTHTFDSAGTYDYWCRLHPEMTGRVVVVDADGRAPAPPAPAPSPAPSSSTPTTTASPAPPAPAPAGDGPQQGPVTIDVVDLDYQPAGATVAAGTTVTWANRGAVPHTVTSSDGGPLDSGFLDPGATWSWTPTAPATLDYLCTIHPEMVGRLVVVAPGASAPASVQPPAPPPSDESPDPPSSETEPTGDEPDGEVVTVRAADVTFDPGSLEVAPGTTVTWEMADEQPHTVTGDAFDSGVLAPGAAWSRTFDEVGTYPYRCLVHPGMTGSVEVVAAAAVGGPDDVEPSASAAPETSTAGAGEDASSGLPFAAAVLLVFMVAAFATGRVTAAAR